MLTTVFVVPITIRRAGATADRYNRPGADWAHATDTVVFGWFDSNPKRIHEDVRNRDESTTRGMAFLPVGTDVRATDRLIINGETHEVFGPPVLINHPIQGAHHIECWTEKFVG